MRVFVSILLYLIATIAWADQLNGIRIWPSPDSTRVVLDVSHQPNFSYFTLKDPTRLVIDLRNTTNRVNINKIENSSELIKKIRQSTPAHKGGLRLVLELNTMIKPVVFALAPAGPYGHRLVIDLPYLEKRSAAITAQRTHTGSQGVVIAIDPGHGGEDPGSIGPKRLYEKRVTLAVSQKLAVLINKQPGMSAVLTRTGDYFVDLNKRSEIARNANADLMVSIHADSFKNATPRGASVWVLSTNRANREMGSWLEQHEKQGELLGGVGKVLSEAAPNPYLAQTFLDLSMDKSRAEGYDVSRYILQSLGKVARLHKREPEHASLAVLKAPDIPSVLVEVGFISNHEEEKLLANANYQDKVARAIFDGIHHYYRNHPSKRHQLTTQKRAAAPVVTKPVAQKTKPATTVTPAPKPGLVATTNRGSMPSNGQVASATPQGVSASGAGVIKPYVAVANEQNRQKGTPVAKQEATMRHVVQRGETLSRLAQRNGVTQAELMKLNKLTSPNIQIGQVIAIPTKGSNAATTSSGKGKSSPSAPMQRHVVKRGESLSGLAVKYRVSQARLVEVNKLKSRNIQVGQVLYIPQR